MVVTRSNNHAFSIYLIQSCQHIQLHCFDNCTTQTAATFTFPAVKIPIRYGPGAGHAFVISNAAPLRERQSEVSSLVAATRWLKICAISAVNIVPLLSLQTGHGSAWITMACFTQKRRRAAGDHDGSHCQAKEACEKMDCEALASGHDAFFAMDVVVARIAGFLRRSTARPI